MENQDNLYEQFKTAAHKAESKVFDRMEAVWNRVEDKLDNKKKRRGAIYWKYAGVAALLLLCLTVGSYIFRSESKPTNAPHVAPENNVVTIDRDKVEQVMAPEPKTPVKERVAVKAFVQKTEPTYVTDTIAFSSKSKKASVWKTYPQENKSAPVAATAIEKPAEGGVYNGVITDALGQPIPGVMVKVKGTTTGAQTDFDGRFALQAKKGDVLGAEFIGMKPASVVLNKKEPVAIAMQDDITVLSEVVVEGYRSTSKVSSNVAVTSLTTEQTDVKRYSPSQKINTGSKTGTVMPVDYATNKMRVRSDDNREYAIKGELPSNGLVYKDKGIAYQGKSTVILRGTGSIKGNTEPLYVIDGVVTNASGFRYLNPNKIESISVLKDASATSRWGNRGSNGVIIVKTKKLTRKEKKALKKLLVEQPTGFTDHTTGEFKPLKIEVDKEEYESFIENQFENPATTPLSTFSIDVDNASYTNVRRFLNNGQTVPKDAVRVEEMVNFFKYQYPQPQKDEPFSINTEYSDAPWNPKHKLLKIGLKGKEIATDNLPASNFVFLVDVSGSMNEPNKLPLLKQSMKLLVNQMRKDDRVAIVVYAGAAGLVLPSTSGDEKEKIIAALDNFSAGGSTAGGAGIELAYKTAQESFIKGGNNRVILATDGDFNVGVTSNKDMQSLIEEKRKSGVFLTCLGYGMGNYKDSKMETLADKGNGNYAYIDNMQEADRFLQKEFKGSMFAIAKDVKIQIEFNPKHVQSYRLIGYENRKLRDEDFANDAIDAGELGSGHTVTALYEIIPVGVNSEFYTTKADLKYSIPQATTGTYNDELATIKFRHKKPDVDKSTETVKVIPNVSAPLKQVSGDFKFAAAVAWFGLKLRDSKLLPNKKTEDIKALAKEGLQNDPEGYRAEFIRLVDMVN
jgi:Ca-activated chloride channel family protein